MARSFQFTAKDGSHPTLNAIDEMLCVETGQSVSEKYYCLEYEILTWFGLCMLMRYGGSGINEDLVTLWVLSHETEPQLERLMYDYLAGRKYTYSAWG